MEDLDMEPSPADLADSTAVLEEWDYLLLQDHLDTVIAEELGAPSKRWTAMGSGERARLRRYERRSDNTVLRLVTRAADTSVSSAPNSGEAA